MGAFFARLAALLALRMDQNAVLGHQLDNACYFTYMRACMYACHLQNALPFANGMHKNCAGVGFMSPGKNILSKILCTYFACMHALCHGVYTITLPFAS